jgi:hypothetical protein
VAQSVRVRGPLYIQDELHKLVDALDGSDAKQQLHTVVDDLNEEQTRIVLERMRGMRNFLEKWGFYL